MKLYSFREHLLELKNRLIFLVVLFCIFFSVSYYFGDKIFDFIILPLREHVGDSRKIIYTNLTEAFLTYVKLAAYSALLFSMPFIVLQAYLFISPGLYKFEKIVVGMALIFAPLLFLIGGFFVYYYVMPRAWEFFLSFETSNSSIKLILEAKISEYVSLVIQLVFAFGLAFQMPIIMVILCALGLVSSFALQKKRRLAIVIIFIVAAFLTPPDVISQIALAIPLLLLYEISVLLCKFVESKEKPNVGHKVD